MKDSNVDSLVKLLVRLRNHQADGNPIPSAIFEALLPIVPLPVMEFLVYRQRGESIDILLIRRPENVAYPRQWQCPGAFIHQGDTLQSAFDRARTLKMGGATIVTKEIMAQQLYTDPHRNGATISRTVYKVQIAEEDDPPLGTFFEIFPNRKLPENLVWEQPMLIDLFPLPK